MSPGMRERYNQAHQANSEAHPVEYLYIGQLVNLFLSTPYAMNSRLWDESSAQQLDKVREFRNSVMHPACSIAATTSSTQAAELASFAEGVAERLHQMVIELRSSKR